MTRIFSRGMPTSCAQAGVAVKLAQLAVNRDEVLGAGQVDEQLHLFLAGVTRNVHRGNGLIDHVGAALEEAVDRAVDVLLVARDGVRGKHDRVALLDVEQAVAAGGKPPEDRGRLALRTGAHDDHFLVRQVQGLVDGHHEQVRECPGSPACAPSSCCRSCSCRRRPACARGARRHWPPAACAR